jgi:heterodisulfide reductase subunit A-like polyferredoxin
MPLRRDVGYYANGDSDSTNGVTNGIQNLSVENEAVEELDAVVVGAGFSGCKLLHDLRKKGFKVKVVEAGSDLGGIWHWNQYREFRMLLCWSLKLTRCLQRVREWIASIPSMRYQYQKSIRRGRGRSNIP